MQTAALLGFRNCCGQTPATLVPQPSALRGAFLISDYFVCVGAQKASTTWLLAVLGRHPDVFATPVKEIHYFDHIRGITSHLSDRKRRARWRKYLQRIAWDWRGFPAYRSQWAWYRAYMRSPIDDAWYEGLFQDRGGARIAGEATPEYAILGAEGFRHIQRLAPEARVIFVLRSPLRQAWSQFLHFEHKKDSRAVRGGTAGAIEFWESAYSAPFRDYASTIDGLLAVFGGERVKFLFYEDMHADRRTAIESLCQFLEIEFQPRHFPDLETRFNVSRDAAIPANLQAYLRERHSEVTRQVIERLGGVPEAWLDDASAAPPPQDR